MSEHPVETLLSRRTFTPIHRDWLPAREHCLAERLRRRPFDGCRNVLLVNATLGMTFYPAIVDFFATLQRVQPQIRVTSASYFDHIFDLAQDVPRRGLTVEPISTVNSWDAGELARFDLVIGVGPSDAFARLMTLDGLRPRLVLLDLGFYHQLIDSTGGGFLKGEREAARYVDPRHDVACYSCQPEAKIVADLSPYYALDRFHWAWLPYIPVGFAHRDYYRSDEQLFDVALLGADGRDYELLEPGLLRGLRFLFMGSLDRAPAVEKLRAEVDVTVVSRVGENDYARLLSLCRCVVLPMCADRQNVLLSVVDAFASGTPLITCRQPGLERLARERAPVIFYDDAWQVRLPLSAVTRRTNMTVVLPRAIRELVSDPRRRSTMSERAIAFARERLDIYSMLETIVDEQLA